MALWKGHRRELEQTSAGVGHMYVQPVPFYVESHKGASLPPLFQRSPLVSTSSHFSVTSRLEHDRKPQTGPLANTLHPRAPPHWNTHFLNELAQQLRDCGTVRLLSKPISEMQDSYRGQAAPHGPLLDHYCTLLALYGQLDPGQTPTVTADPLVSTAHAYYRRFSRSEIAPSSALEAPSSYLSLNKSSTHSRLPGHKAPPTMSCHPWLPRPSVPLPYGGKHSLYRDSFRVPAPHPAPSGPSPVAIPDWRQAGTETGAGGAKRGLLRDIVEVPKMYLTENRVYGGNRTVLV
ncbi:stabilizer of axonemal microtubules 3 isoform X1 [Salvelinus alpinus]|uniref:stabilizer of axonemal microtubules 3 isoform X1 n=1 Tax=Salvelinus alpinus TaxID=8036 RepID=UPI0039FCA280